MMWMRTGIKDNHRVSSRQVDSKSSSSAEQNQGFSAEKKNKTNKGTKDGENWRLVLTWLTRGNKSRESLVC
jgi:hypothetical protein